MLNNEQGFEEQNIRYLCDVGRSTKGKHKYGYIGNFYSGHIIYPYNLSEERLSCVFIGNFICCIQYLG